MRLIFRKFIVLFIVLGTLFGLLNPLTVRANSLVKSTSDQSSNRLTTFESLVKNWSKTGKAKPVQAVSNNNQVIYLTFDDGPDPVWTPQVLDLLNTYHAKATFFVIGIQARSNPEIIQQIARSEQMIGNHTYNHLDLAKLGWGDFSLEIGDTNNAIEDALSENGSLSSQIAQCIRPPYGSLSPNVWTFAYRMAYDVSMWSLDTMDWSGISSEDILKNVQENVKPGSIILMHDGGEDRTETINALALVLHELTIQGYSFASLCNSDGQVIKYP